MTSTYQNLPILPVGINPSTEKLQEQILLETNNNDEKNTVDVSDNSYEPVSIEHLPPSFVDDVKSAVLEDSYEKTITDNSAYSTGMRIFKTNQLQPSNFTKSKEVESYKGVEWRTTMNLNIDVMDKGNYSDG